MKRKKALEHLQKQLKFLKEKNVAKLMKEQRIDELKKISAECDLDSLQKFFNSSNHLNLKTSEIPENCYYELAFLVNRIYDVFDYEVFKDYNQFIYLLKSTKEELAEGIARIMLRHNLSTCTLREIVLLDKTKDQ